MATWLDEAFDDVKDTFEYKLSSLDIEITEAIIKRMIELSMSKQELSEKSGIAQVRLNKLLRDCSKVGLADLLKIAGALGCKLTINFIPE